MNKISISRCISRAFFGKNYMVCAIADWYQWKIRRALNLLVFWDKSSNHCADCADYESAKEMKGSEYEFFKPTPDSFRKDGMM